MGSARPHLIPLSIKLALTAWLLVWMPLRAAAYPAASWLSFCAYGSIILVAGVLLEDRLLVSWQAVALLVAQAAYALDALWRGPGTAYLFDARVAFAIRSLSLFHFVMPLIALDAVRRLGYDRRALPLQIATAAIVLPLTHMAAGPPMLAFGGAFSTEAKSPPLVLVVLFVVLATFCYAPAHALLSMWRGQASPSRIWRRPRPVRMHCRTIGSRER